MPQKATYKYPLLNTGKKTLLDTTPPATVRDFTHTDYDYCVFLNKKSKGFYVAIQGGDPGDAVSVNLIIYYYMDQTTDVCYYQKITVSAASRTAIFVETKVTPYVVWIAKETDANTHYFEVFIE